MNVSLEKRLAALKAQIGGNPVVLVMRDGSVHEIAGTGRHFLKLAAQIDTENPRGELAWIRGAVHIEESGGGMFQLLAAIASGPNEDE